MRGDIETGNNHLKGISFRVDRDGVCPVRLAQGEADHSRAAWLPEHHVGPIDTIPGRIGYLPFQRERGHLCTGDEWQRQEQDGDKYAKFHVCRVLFKLHREIKAQVSIRCENLCVRVFRIAGGNMGTDDIVLAFLLVKDSA